MRPACSVLAVLLLASLVALQGAGAAEPAPGAATPAGAKAADGKQAIVKPPGAPATQPQQEPAPQKKPAPTQKPESATSAPQQPSTGSGTPAKEAPSAGTPAKDAKVEEVEYKFKHRLAQHKATWDDMFGYLKDKHEAEKYDKYDARGHLIVGGGYGHHHHHDDEAEDDESYGAEERRQHGYGGEREYEHHHGPEEHYDSREHYYAEEPRPHGGYGREGYDKPAYERPHYPEREYHHQGRDAYHHHDHQKGTYAAQHVLVHDQPALRYGPDGRPVADNDPWY